MRVSAGVREDKDPTDSLPACATCISSCRSCCAQIRPASIAVYRCTSWKRTCGERMWKKRGIREEEGEQEGDKAGSGSNERRGRRDPEKKRRRKKKRKKRKRRLCRKKEKERKERNGGEAAMNDRNQRNTAPRKLPGIHPEYIIHTGVPAGGVLLRVKRSRAPERTRPEGREACPWTAARSAVPRWITKKSRGFTVAFAKKDQDHPELFVCTKGGLTSSPCPRYLWIVGKSF